MHGGIPAHQLSSLCNKKALSGFFDDITSKCKFPTWRPAGCWRGRSWRSRGALQPQTPTSAPTNTPCSSLSDGTLTSGRLDTSAGKSNEVRLFQLAPHSYCVPFCFALYSHEIQIPASSRRLMIPDDATHTLLRCLCNFITPLSQDASTGDDPPPASHHPCGYIIIKTL